MTATIYLRNSTIANIEYHTVMREKSFFWFYDGEGSIVAAFNSEDVVSMMFGDIQ